MLRSLKLSSRFLIPPLARFVGIGLSGGAAGRQPDRALVRARPRYSLAAVGPDFFRASF